MNEVLADIQRWLDREESVVLATVVSTWGSAPRGVGAKMAFTHDAKISGSVSGGCVEGAVIEAGLQLLQSGKPELLHFGVADETAFSVGLACGGNIEVFVKKLNLDLYEIVRTSLEAGYAVVSVTVIGGLEEWVGKELLFTERGQVVGSLGIGIDDEAVRLAREGLGETQSGSVEFDLESGERVRLFVDVISPPPVLIMVGGVHIAIALAGLAKTLGYRTVVIDPRKAFGSQERFPHVDQLIQEWPEEAFKKILLTRGTCVAVLTHDPKIDDPALEIVLDSPVFYIGVLGSRKTHEKRRQRLLNVGLSDEQINHLHAPIGLDLGGRSPEETALAIMAEIVAVRHGREI